MKNEKVKEILKKTMIIFLIFGGIIEGAGGIITNNFYLTLLGLVFVIEGLHITNREDMKGKIKRYEKLCLKQQETIRKQNEIIRKLLNQ